MDMYPPQPDDTQPTPLDNTQPIKPILRRKRLIQLIVLVLVPIAIIVFVPLLFASTRPPETLTVQLRIDDQTYAVDTQVRNVSRFLEEQQLTIDPGDLLFPPANTPLEDGLLVEIKRARTIAITVDGRTSILRTTSSMPYDVLNTAGVKLNPSDIVLVDDRRVTESDLLTWSGPFDDITIHSTFTVTVIDGEETLEIETTSPTVGNVLFEAGIPIYVADVVTPDVNEPVLPGTVIRVDRSRPVTIQADGVTLETRTSGPQVIDAVTEAGIVLSGMDYTIPAETTEITSGMEITVVRVTEEIVTEEETIPHESVYQADATLELDTRQVSQAGQDGILQRSIRVRYENGVETSWEVESEDVIQEPINQVISYGTNVVIRTLQTPDGPVEYWRKLEVYTTSYKPEALGGDNITSVGETLRKGIIGVNPDIIPYYTNMYVEGYGVGFAADTGAPRNNPYWIDLGYEDHDFEIWYGWGEVYLLTPVPDEIDYLLPITSRGGPIP